MATSGALNPPPAGGPTIYHLADVRLGGAFPFLGDAGTAHRNQVRETFVRTVDQGVALAPSVVLITGNLLGTPFPSRELTEFVRTQLGRFTERSVPVLITAGSLDALYDKTYAGGALGELERVTVFPAQPKTETFPDLNLSIVGVSWSSAPVQLDFLASITPNRSQRYLVGACYLQWLDTDEGLRTLRRQIVASSANYLALGGSPVRRDLSVERVAAWSPGAPEMIGMDEGEGSPLLVELDGTPTVTPKPVAKRRAGRFTLQPIAYATTEDLANAIRALGDPNLAAVIRLTGQSRINQWIDATELRERLAREFLALEIIDESRPSLEDMDAAPYPELSVAGKFVKVARAEMGRAATEDARRRVGAALRQGLALLEGWRPS